MPYWKNTNDGVDKNMRMGKKKVPGSMLLLAMMDLLAKSEPSLFAVSPNRAEPAVGQGGVVATKGRV
jgi:hypothetical protein